ncbi:MAG: hypothetical protein WCJ54_06910, partial [Actinomycetota bacterium]
MNKIIKSLVVILFFACFWLVPNVTFARTVQVYDDGNNLPWYKPWDSTWKCDKYSVQPGDWVEFWFHDKSFWHERSVQCKKNTIFTILGGAELDITTSTGVENPSTNRILDYLESKGQNSSNYTAKGAGFFSYLVGIGNNGKCLRGWYGIDSYKGGIPQYKY